MHLATFCVASANYMPWMIVNDNSINTTHFFKNTMYNAFE